MPIGNVALVLIEVRDLAGCITRQVRKTWVGAFARAATFDQQLELGPALLFDQQVGEGFRIGRREPHLCAESSLAIFEPGDEPLLAMLRWVELRVFLFPQGGMSVLNCLREAVEFGGASVDLLDCLDRVGIALQSVDRKQRTLGCEGGKLVLCEV